MAPKLTLDELDDQQKQLNYRVTTLESKLKWLLGGTGLTLVMLLGASYWLGSELATVKTTVISSAEKTDAVYKAVWTDDDKSLATRTRLMETKLSAMDVKLDDLVKFREKTSVKIHKIPESKPSP
ncbi:MAG TPA: hypothetical protein VNG71_04075 [Pyrinomonadaceae bacterium]|nr:hypothetical protein [Pyrinomonadaceae bacterium]